MKRAIFWRLGLAFLAVFILIAILHHTTLAPWVVLLIAALAALALTYSLAEDLSAPTEKLRDELQNIDQSRTVLDPQDYPHELRDIANKIDDLTAQNRNAADIRRDFFANASHELKTPLTSIKGAAELLCSDISLDAGQQRELLTRIGIEAERMHNLIADIIMINRLESGEGEGDTEEVSFDAILRTCVEEVTPLAEQNGLTIDLRSEPAVLTANRKNVQDLISNLVINAVNYATPGGHIDIRHTHTQSEILFTIRNDAEPISPAHRHRVFERFYRTDPGRSKTAGGTGLGLAIVKHAVDSLGGTIGLESDENIGVLFTVILPL
ncbi:MAG: ATP-binding protein [Oscillospiraceae bacterium]|nr:ATP-binding protein [Oscillospiraceae bacterium]